MSDVRSRQCNGSDPNPRTWFKVRLEVWPFVTYFYLDNQYVGSLHSVVPASYVVGVLTPNGEGNLVFFEDLRVGPYRIEIGKCYPGTYAYL